MTLTKSTIIREKKHHKVRLSNRFDKIVQTSLLAAVVSRHRPVTGNIQLCCPKEDSHPRVDRPLSQVTSNGKMTSVVSAETRENLQLSVPLRAKWSRAGASPETRPRPLVPGLHTQLLRPLMLHMPSHEVKLHCDFLLLYKNRT